MVAFTAYDAINVAARFVALNDSPEVVLLSAGFFRG